jgi:hypothetical protein
LRTTAKITGYHRYQIQTPDVAISIATAQNHYNTDGNNPIHFSPLCINCYDPAAARFGERATTKCLKCGNSIDPPVPHIIDHTLSGPNLCQWISSRNPLTALLMAETLVDFIRENFVYALYYDKAVLVTANNAKPKVLAMELNRVLEQYG